MNHKKITKSSISLGIFVILCLFVEVIGSYWTRETVSIWYPKLLKPSWTPPDWVFGPVWSLLYIMIAVSGWLIFKAQSSPQRSTALRFYFVQLGLNFIWSFLFFSLRSPLLGLIDIVLLCLMVMLTIMNAWQVRRSAAFLLIPYLLWIIYAASVNAGVWLLNDSF